MRGLPYTNSTFASDWSPAGIYEELARLATDPETKRLYKQQQHVSSDATTVSRYVRSRGRSRAPRFRPVKEST